MSAAKDARLYGRFTIDFADSPKIAPLSDGAFRVLVEMTLHSRRMLDDGFVDERIAHRKWRKKFIDELLTNDDEKPSLIAVEGGYRIHDFAEHQQTRADIEKKRSAGRKGGAASAQARAEADAKQVLEHNPTTPQAITETESETEKRESPASRGTRLSPDWTLSESLMSWAAENAPHVDLKLETEKFRNYWIAKPGKDGVKLNWDATWKNWVLRVRDDYAKNAPSSSQRLRIRGGQVVA